MTVIFASKTTVAPSADQDAAGPVALIASGSFGGAVLLIEVRSDSQGYVPLYQFAEAGAVKLALVTGQQWRASLSNVSALTSVNLSALAG
ncbi:hypothetical protein [Pseudomonas sp.]|uniref:hypothetical protein n=1 Tax=Pseudomonas sp. TaxID=306 RepID=UPI002585E321|nr:hypothetical protein [Pseudomonas sp.]